MIGSVEQGRKEDRRRRAERSAKPVDDEPPPVELLENRIRRDHHHEESRRDRSVDLPTQEHTPHLLFVDEGFSKERENRDDRRSEEQPGQDAAA